MVKAVTGSLLALAGGIQARGVPPAPLMASPVWIEIELPRHDAAVDAIMRQCGARAGARLASLFEVPVPGLTGASSDLQSSRTVGFSLFPSARFLLVQVADPEAAAHAMRGFMDEDAIGSQVGRVRYFPGTQAVAGVSDQHVTFATTEDLAARVLASRLPVHATAGVQAEEVHGSDGLLIAIGSVRLNLELIRAALAPLPVDVPYQQARQVSAMGPITPGALVLARLVAALPDSLGEISLTVAAGPGKVILNAGVPAHLPPACQEAASEGKGEGPHFRLAGHGPLLGALARALPWIGMVLGEPEAVVDLLGEGEAALSAAGQGWSVLAGHKRRREPGWYITVAPVPDAGRRSDPTEARLEISGFCLALSGSQAGQGVTVVIPPALLVEWLGRLDGLSPLIRGVDHRH